MRAARHARARARHPAHKGVRDAHEVDLREVRARGAQPDAGEEGAICGGHVWSEAKRSEATTTERKSVNGGRAPLLSSIT